MHDDNPTQPGPVSEGDPATPSAPPAEHDAQPDAWSLEPEELPRRPRRRLLAPLPLSLFAVLLIVCGFIAGVLVEKGQSSGSAGSASAAGGIAARFAALRAGATGATGASGASSGAAGGVFGRGGAGAGGGATIGQVSFVSGDTLYVTTTEGNTVKVSSAPGATVTKTVSSDLKAIHPGETVIVTGTTGANGSVSAESIRASAAGAGGGGLGALFGGGGGARARAGGAGGEGGGGGPALFGG